MVTYILLLFLLNTCVGVNNLSLVKRTSLVLAGRFLDSEIVKQEEGLVGTVVTARDAMNAATLESNKLSVSYGLAVLVGSIFYVVSVVYGKPVGNYSTTDWGAILSNIGYFWGYGAPYLVYPDPGCGVDQIYYIPSFGK